MWFVFKIVVIFVWKVIDVWWKVMRMVFFILCDELNFVFGNWWSFVCEGVVFFGW